MNEKSKRKRLLRLLEHIPVVTVLLECPAEDALALLSAKQDMKLDDLDVKAYEQALRVYHSLKRFDLKRRGMSHQISVKKQLSRNLS